MTSHPQTGKPQEKQGVPQLFKKTFVQFSDDDCMSMAAGLAYYTVFALPPLLVILIAIGSAVFKREQVERALVAHMQGVMDARQIDEIVARTQDTGAGITATVIGVVLLLFGATGVIAQLQISLNRVWEVEPDPDVGGVRNFVTKRVLSLALILAIAFLLLVSLVLSSLLTAVGSYISNQLPGDFWQPVLWVANIVLSWLIFTLLFASIYKILPDAEITWRDVAIGSAATALLFMIGQFLLSLYLGNAEVGGPYGAAGSLVLVLVWVYYSSLILLLGAEFTQVWARRYGKQIEPSDGAVRAIHITRRNRNAEESDSVAHGG